MKRAAMFFIGVVLSAGATLPAHAASATRQTAYESDHRIVNILFLLGTGLVDEVLHGDMPISTAPIGQLAVDPPTGNDPLSWLQQIREMREHPNTGLMGFKFDPGSFELYVDGQRQKSRFFGPLRAMIRTFVFAISKKKVPGSVQYRYALRGNGLLIKRETLIDDGHLKLTTGIYGSLSLADSAVMTNDARQFVRDGQTKTRIVTTVQAHVPIGRRPCGPVTRIVESVMSRVIDRLMSEVDCKALQVAGRGAAKSANILGQANHFIQEAQNGLR
jgi:hypothetical protein